MYGIFKYGSIFNAIDYMYYIVEYVLYNISKMKKLDSAI